MVPRHPTRQASHREEISRGQGKIDQMPNFSAIMKALWHQLPQILLLHLMIACNANGAMERMVESGAFEIMYDDSVNSACEQAMLEEATDFYKWFLELRDASHIFSPLGIKERFTFNKLPALKMYSVDVRLLFSGRSQMIIKSALVNCNDVSVHFFRDDTSSFNAVIREFLPTIIDSNLVEDLINLYLFSLSIKFSHYPLYALEDYRDIWIAHQLDIDNKLASLEEHDKPISPVYNLMLYSDEEIDKDIATVEQLIEPAKIHSTETGYLAEIYSWEDLDGKIELWRFSISRAGFNVIERKVVATGLGPNMAWLR